MNDSFSPEPRPSGNPGGSEDPGALVDCFHAWVRGRVQGVGFRMWTISAASRLGVAGWVRNTREGDVEVEAEGDRAALDALAHQLGKGPILARVRDLDIRWDRRARQFSDFTLRD